MRSSMPSRSYASIARASSPAWPESAISQSMPTVQRSVAGSRLSACSAASMPASRWLSRLLSSPNQAVFQASAYCGQPQHPRAVAGHQDRDRPVRRRQQHRAADLVVAAGKGQPLAAQQRPDDLQRLFEPGNTVARREAECQVLPVAPASAQTQHETITADAVGGDCHLRQQRRAAKRHAHHKLAQLDRAGRRSERGQDGPALMEGLGGPARSPRRGAPTRALPARRAAGPVHPTPRTATSRRSSSRQSLALRPPRPDPVVKRRCS
jgi:hypothetical protein